MWLFLHELELRIKPHVVGFGPLRARGREGFGERLRGDAFGKNEREAVDSWRSPDSNTGLTVMEGTLMGMFWTRSSLRRVPEGCQEFRIISGDACFHITTSNWLGTAYGGWGLGANAVLGTA